MKTLPGLVAILLFVNPVLRSQTPTDPAADLVLGAADFDTAGSAENSSSGIAYPMGIDIDPVSGKVFVSCYQQNRILRFASAGALANGAAAEMVVGQTSLTHNSSGLSRSTLNSPHGICVDHLGRLWVADTTNHRVLMYEDAATLVNAPEAHLVLGQQDFDSANTGTGAAQMANPTGVFVDASDNLWVCDNSNHRVLKFASVSALSTGAAASVVIGQSGFGLGGNSTAVNRLSYPADVLVDEEDHLWIADQSNHRVLRFDGAGTLASGASAAIVLGQVNFTTNSPGTTATTMRIPSSLAMQSDGSLWVADQLNSRVLFFLDAASKSTGAAADGVIGQPDLNTGTAGLSSKRMNQPSHGIAFDLEGRLWVSDTQNNRALRFPTVPLPPSDVTPPLLSVNKVPKTTKKSSLKISGTSSDDGGVADVKYRVGKGAYTRATGTTSWSFKARLKPGNNKIQLYATDTAGNASPAKTLSVARK